MNKYYFEIVGSHLQLQKKKKSQIWNHN